MFEVEFEKLLKQQQQSATGQRLEMLKRDLTGTKKLLEVVVWTALKSFEGVILEYEMISSSGVKIYIDVLYVPLLTALECEGFVYHAEKITRDRFDFEKTRARSMALNGITYMPFSMDQLDKQPDTCRRSFYELLGRYSKVPGNRAMLELTVNEREVIRYGMYLHRNLRLEDVKYCLQCSYDLAIKIIRGLITKQMMIPRGSGSQRFHEYEILPLAREYMLQKH